MLMLLFHAPCPILYQFIRFVRCEQAAANAACFAIPGFWVDSIEVFDLCHGAELPSGYANH
jgi:hypothetical protein